MRRRMRSRSEASTACLLRGGGFGGQVEVCDVLCVAHGSRWGGGEAVEARTPDGAGEVGSFVLNPFGPVGSQCVGAEELHEGLLNGVLGVLPVAEQRKGDPVKKPGVAVDERREGGLWVCWYQWSEWV